MSDKITASHLAKKALLYIRQSSESQVRQNLESQRLQYAMKDRLRALGFRQIEVIDEDLGRSASGFVERRGFEKLVSEVCLAKVGAVAAHEVSRFARNSRDWGQLVEMCRVVNTLLIDHESTYDPRHSNDRLLLGLKGSLSSYELDLIRQRARTAVQQKAARGELRLNLPAGYVRGHPELIQKDPDRRVQRSIELVFAKYLELGSIRQTLVWFLDNELQVPVMHKGGGRWEKVWRRPTNSMMSRLLNNPVHAGYYAFGKHKQVCEVDGEVLRKRTVRLPRDQWQVLIPDHHEGYISRETFDRIQQMLSDNASGFRSSGAPKEGSALLAGLLRCRRCGNKLRVTYTGARRTARYMCDRAYSGVGAHSCLSFGGQGLDDAVSRQVLRVVSPGAIAAAVASTEAVRNQQSELVEALKLDMQAARYAAEHAQRQYDAIDPANRLVAAELETRWNKALEQVAEQEKRLAEVAAEMSLRAQPDIEEMSKLAQHLPQLWDDPETDIRLKKRIMRTVIEEVIVDVDSEAGEIQAVIHWKGGVHTKASARRRRQGQHGKSTSKDVVDAVRVLARVCRDQQIAQYLSRNGLKTGKGNSWTRERVKSLRRWNQIPVHDVERQASEGWMNLDQAATHLGVSPKTLRLAAEREEVAALHPLPHGPWVILRDDLDRSEVRSRFDRIRKRSGTPEKPDSGDQNLTIPGTC